MSTSTLGYALLALLARGPSTGYELAHRARRPLGYFWTASHSRIHPELDRLRDDGYVQWEAAPGPGPHDKKVYSITPAGREALAGWVTTPPNPAPNRSELLLKTYAIWTGDLEEARGLFASELAEHLRRLAEYSAAWERVTAANGGDVPHPYEPEFGNCATLRYGIGYERHNIEWCEWVIDQLAR